MAKARSRGVSTTGLLLAALGLFFVVLGITGIIPEAGEGIFQLSKGRTTLEVAFGVMELLCGVFFLYDAFGRIPRKNSTLVLLVILVLWAARVFVSEFVQGMDFRSSGIVFRPSFWAWALTLATDLVIGACIWLAYKSE